MTFIYGDASAIVSRQHAHDIVSHIPNAHGPIAIPESHHHVLLDQPLSLVVGAARGAVLVVRLKPDLQGLRSWVRLQPDSYLSVAYSRSALAFSPASVLNTHLSLIV